MKRNIYIILSIFLLTILLGGCGSKEKAPTIVLVSIDTWRYDATGFLGNMTPSPTPFLDSIAPKGLVATNAMTPVPVTSPSHWSMLTGRWPWRDGMQINGDRPQESHNPTLAQLLKGAGWRTAAFVSCRVLDHRIGFAKGFDHYDDMVLMDGSLAHVDMPERRADHTTAALLKLVSGKIEKGDKLFLWVHFFDPHFPYHSPRGPFKGKHGPYMGEVAFVDQQLRKLAQGLADLGRPMDKSLWVVLSDHGEGLGEHGEDSHGLLLHGATTRIPLLLAGPQVPAGTYQNLAATVDVYPTILSYAGVSVPAGDGIDLLDGPGSEDRAIPLETMMPARSFGLAYTQGIRHQNLLWESSPQDHLWDLDKDPGEQNDLALRAPKRLRALKKRRSEYGSSLDSAPPKIETKILEELQSLGYVPGNMKPGKESVRAFVKEGRLWHEQAVTLQQQGRYDEADRLYRKFLAKYERSPNTWQRAGIVSVQLKDYPEAEKRFQKALELDPTNPAYHLNLANIYYFTQRLPEAEKAYKQVLFIDPEDMFALYNLGLLLEKQMRFKEASTFYQKYLELYPNHKNAPFIRQKLKMR